ncbi:FtsL-like putative cell division protein [uncultured Flavobacterium sp.]|uniref:FtsL-like putative cell division protein n=1 Tax=uncultured Flavobacterium sp. TaxID=165435 RepID=UPI0030ECF91C|tara:strand:- start:135863 stop:136210 length:348 start_codon:yes stop_codon:yes gene_type:complete
MKANIYSLLKAKFLVSDDSLKNWKFIVFLIVLAMIMIANNHRYDAKNYRITELTNEVKELRSKFVDTRSDLMKLKMESTITTKMEARGIKPSEVSPQKIKVLKTEEKSIVDKIWQ